METLIQITTDAQGASVVSARDLYQFLQVKTEFAKWCKRMFDYGFTPQQDYVQVIAKIDENPLSEAEQGFTQNRVKVGRPETDYDLTLDCAKEIAMLQRSEQGKAARQYFIDCENRLRSIASQTPPAVGPATDPLLLQILHTQSQLMTGQQSQLDQLRADVEQIKAGHRPVRGRDTLPGLRHSQPTPPARNPTLRQQINQQVNLYCERFQATQSETYRYLYGRLQATYGIDIYRFVRTSTESWLDAIERYGYLNELYRVVQDNITNAQQP